MKKCNAMHSCLYLTIVIIYDNTNIKSMNFLSQIEEMKVVIVLLFVIVALTLLSLLVYLVCVVLGVLFRQ